MVSDLRREFEALQSPGFSVQMLHDEKVDCDNRDPRNMMQYTNIRFRSKIMDVKA
jgi:hypothetical protein